MLCVFFAALGVRGVLLGAEGRVAAANVVPLAWLWGGFASVLVIWARDRSVSLFAVIALALLLRGTQIGTPWLLSDDAWRYLWEGTLLNHGGNPFLQAPESVMGLDDALRDRVNHPDISSIYPPLALWWFRVLAVAGTPLAAQVMTAALDLLTVTALWHVGQRTIQQHWPALLYALHPLPVIELAGSAHIEGPAICAAALAIWAWHTDRTALSWSAFAAGGAIKLLPFMVLPALVGRLHGKRTMMATLTTAIVFLALAIPILDGGSTLFSGLESYTRHWSFNGLLYPWLAPSLGELTRPVLAILGLGAIAHGLWSRLPPAQLLLRVGLAFMAITPTAHPWYGLWVLMPALATGRFWLAIATIPLIGSYGVLLGYDPIAETWSEPVWLWWVTWLPSVGLALLPILLRSEKIPTAP